MKAFISSAVVAVAIAVVAAVILTQLDMSTATTYATSSVRL